MNEVSEETQSCLVFFVDFYFQAARHMMGLQQVFLFSLKKSQNFKLGSGQLCRRSGKEVEGAGKEKR